jgi:twitching motility protein PilT
MTTWNLANLLKRMSELKASDLIITAGTRPHYRVHGALKPLEEAPPLTAAMTEELAFSVLNPGQVAVFRERRSIDLSRGFEGDARYRINISYQRDSVSMAVRLIPYVVPAFDELGLPEIVKDFAFRPHGLMLITGPAGSGKSTTMAAMIDYVNNSRGQHIICIEDPIEYLHQHKKSIVQQRELLSDTPTFSEALRCVFRQSPDIIMVGEMRDLETIQLVLTLAETGHLILGTLHTQDTTHAVNRIVDMFPANQQQQIYVQLSLVLVGIISQQLLATRDGTRRVLAYEVMNVNNAIRNQIREMQIQQIYSVLQTSRSEGMVTMNDSLWQLCQRGLIDEEMAIRRSPRPKEMAGLMADRRQRR